MDQWLKRVQVSEQLVVNTTPKLFVIGAIIIEVLNSIAAVWKSSLESPHQKHWKTYNHNHCGCTKIKGLVMCDPDVRIKWQFKPHNEMEDIV